jgi:hypothetical protein
VPCAVAALFGSSLHVVSGPTNMISLVLFATVAPFAVVGSRNYIELVLGVTLVVGVMQWLIGALRLGGLANFISPAALRRLHQRRRGADRRAQLAEPARPARRRASGRGAPAVARRAAGQRLAADRRRLGVHDRRGAAPAPCLAAFAAPADRAGRGDGAGDGDQPLVARRGTAAAATSWRRSAPCHGLAALPVGPRSTWRGCPISSASPSR